MAWWWLASTYNRLFIGFAFSFRVLFIDIIPSPLQDQLVQSIVININILLWFSLTLTCTKGSTRLPFHAIKRLIFLFEQIISHDLLVLPLWGAIKIWKLVWKRSQGWIKTRARDFPSRSHPWWLGMVRTNEKIKTIFHPSDSGEVSWLKTAQAEPVILIVETSWKQRALLGVSVFVVLFVFRPANQILRNPDRL